MAWFSRRRKETPAITASAEQVKLKKNEGPKRQGSNDKQRKAWVHYDLIPEMWFAHNYLANALRRIRIFPATQPDPSQPPIPLLPTDGALGARANAELDRLRDVDGTHGTLIHDMALQLCVPGEGLFAWYDDLKTGREIFGIYSTDQLQRYDDEWVLIDHEGQSVGQGTVIGKDMEAGGDVLVNRFWRPHPHYNQQPDSAFFALAHTLDEILGLDQLYRSNGKSRVPSGILIAPQEIKMKEATKPGVPRGAGGPDQAKMDPLVRAILEAITTPLADEESAGNVAPPVIKAPADLIEKFRHMTFGREFDAQTAARYDRLLQRAADGVDMPASLVMGASDLNHWSLWQVDEDAFDSHLAPLTQLECASITDVFLEPALLDIQGPGDEKVFTWYDASALISHPNKSKDALAANKQIIISDSATRRLLGYSEEDAPDDAERAEKIDREKASRPGNTPGGTEAGPPQSQRLTLVASATPVAELGLELARIDHDLRVQVQAAIEGVVLRALEKAGNKMRARAGERYAPLLAGVENRDVCRTLGAPVVNTFATDEELTDEAVAGAVPLFTRYVGRVQRIVRSTAQDHDPEADLDQLERQQDADRQRGAEVLATSIVALVTSLLYSPSIDAPAQGEVEDVLVPAGIMRDSLAAAGGAPSSTAISPLSDNPQGGVATGETAMEIMIRVGLTPSGWQWVYGDSSRKMPFEGHADLDGIEFLDWQDEALRVREEDDWIGREFYAPGDHLYCQCDFAPALTTDDATTDDTESEPVPVEA